MNNRNEECECSDSGCPNHRGFSSCRRLKELVLYYRADMEDLTGTYFCEECAEDAMNSGVFSTERSD